MCMSWTCLRYPIKRVEGDIGREQSLITGNIYIFCFLRPVDMKSSVKHCDILFVFLFAQVSHNAINMMSQTSSYIVTVASLSEK